MIDLQMFTFQWIYACVVIQLQSDTLMTYYISEVVVFLLDLRHHMQLIPDHISML